VHIDANTLEDQSLIEGDLCIIGAGAAGISMALEWIGRSEKVILLEGGGFDRDENYQALYRGDSIGERYQVPLETARLHYFGGTTGHWAGWCSPMDPLNFKKRDWVPNSGWPISREELDPYYARTQSLLELGPFNYDAEKISAQEPRRNPILADSEFVDTKMWQFSPPTRFGTKYREDIVAAANIHLYTHANVCDIEANESGNRVEGLVVKSLEGRTHRVEAKRYVLACGAMQNARMLLASNKQVKPGLGNENDLVGRYFMEHFEMIGGQLILKDPNALELYSRNYGGPRLACGELTMKPEILERHECLNGTMSLRPGIIEGEEVETFFNRWNQRLTAENGERKRRPGADVAPEDQRFYMLFCRNEQAPNPLSRIKLDSELDALGVPRMILDWQTTEQDKRSMQTLYKVLAMEFAKYDLGRVRLLDWLLDEDVRWPDDLSGGFHHMGTTRMHDDPKQGVVDSNSKVHSISNLWVAGSSVFPTSGAPNPTLTLVALSLRLSDHLKEN